MKLAKGPTALKPQIPSFAVMFPTLVLRYVEINTRTQFYFRIVPDCLLKFL